MESIDELQHSYDHTTSTRSQSRQVPIENQDEEIVVLVRECKKIIVVHHPSDQKIIISEYQTRTFQGKPPKLFLAPFLYYENQANQEQKPPILFPSKQANRSEWVLIIFIS